ncbi:hypothetical protein B0H13DRAFT_1934536, partial [Mycena leptocephala]
AISGNMQNSGTEGKKQKYYTLLLYTVSQPIIIQSGNLIIMLGAAIQSECVCHFWTDDRLSAADQQKSCTCGRDRRLHRFAWVEYTGEVVPLVWAARVQPTGRRRDEICTSDRRRSQPKQRTRTSAQQSYSRKYGSRGDNDTRCQTEGHQPAEDATASNDNLVKHRNFDEKRRKEWRVKLGLRRNNARKDRNRDPADKFRRVRNAGRIGREGESSGEERGVNPDADADAAGGQKEARSERRETGRRHAEIRVDQSRGGVGITVCGRGAEAEAQKSPSVSKGLRPERRPLKLKVITSNFINSRWEEERIDSHICLKLSSGCVVVQSRSKKESSERE